MNTADFGHRLGCVASDFRVATGLEITWKDADAQIWSVLPERVRVHCSSYCIATKSDLKKRAVCIAADEALDTLSGRSRVVRCPFGVVEVREALWLGNEFQGLLCVGVWRRGGKPACLPAYTPTRAQAGFRLARALVCELLPVRQAQLSGLAVRSRQDAVIVKALELVETRLSAGLRIRDAARWVNLSPSRFAHRFMDVCGVAFGRYLQTRLMREACRKLALPGVRVLDVALDLGYAGPDHFATLFKRHTGLTPSRFRARVAEREA